MNRYATLAIFVTLIIIVLGSANSYFLKKAKLSKASKPAVEKVIEPDSRNLHRAEPVLSDEELEDESEDDEDVEEFVNNEEERQVADVPQTLQVPTAREARVPKPENPKFSLNKKAAPDKNKCYAIDENTVSVPCEEEFETQKACIPGAVIISEAQDSVSSEYLGSNNGQKKVTDSLEADKSGSMMSRALARKVCEAKGMRLPSRIELLRMYSAQKNNCGAEFLEGSYWAAPLNDNISVYCPANSHKCVHFEGDFPVQVLNRVRCVK